MTLSLFNCITVEGEMYLVWDLAVKCFKDRHLFWVLVNGVPMILFWVIGMPLFGLLMLWKNRKYLWTAGTLSKYRILYIGLKAEYYYWEYVNTFWKVSLLVINVFIEYIMYKVLGSIALLVIVLFI